MSKPELPPSELFDRSEKLYRWLGAIKGVLPPRALVVDQAAPPGVAFWWGARLYDMPLTAHMLGFSYTVVNEPCIANRVRLVRSTREITSMTPHRQDPAATDVRMTHTDSLVDIIFTLRGPAWVRRASTTSTELDTVRDFDGIGTMGTNREVTVTSSPLEPVTTNEANYNLRQVVRSIADFMSAVDDNGDGVPRGHPLMPSSIFNPLIDELPLGY